jgi:SpoVK/Ycf46/Vps4 family AAA+-type ATPase
VARKFGTRKDAPLNIADFEFLQPQLEAVLRILEGSLAHGVPGVHILLHGNPGTGKTTLAQVLSSSMHAELMAVQTQDGDGDQADGIARVKWLGFGQKLLSGSGKRIFHFDEAEDLFPAHIGAFFGTFGRSSAFHKGWINEMLENTPVPTIWTANDVSWVDPAHLRRFTCVLEVPTPPASVRRRLLENEIGRHGVRAAWMNNMSREEAVTPGEIAQLGMILRTTGEKAEAAECLLESVLREKLPVLGAKPLRKAPGQGDLGYDVSLLNTAPAIDRVVDSLRNGGRASALFYGAPGTGKSELVRHLSIELDRPVVMKQGSELLSMWVGGTEKNIAEAFKRAERERAILFLDESDSFLKNREGAQRSWEVTQVNELLVGMERFEGVFIAATNLVDGLDPAAFRRFDVKVRFEPLRLDQKVNLFRSVIAGVSNSATKPRNDYSQVLAGMGQLTLGDFRAALRAIRLTGRVAEPAALLEALREEYRFKEEGKRQPIGFVR